MDQTQEVQYRADAAICNACPVKEACTESKRGRHVHRSFFADYLDRVKASGQTLAYHKALNKQTESVDRTALWRRQAVAWDATLSLTSAQA
jgi:hypothetical protein